MQENFKKKIDSALDTTIEAQVLTVVAKQLACDVQLIDPATSFTELGADELDSIEMIMRFEEQFGLEIHDEDAEQLTSVLAVTNYVTQRCAQ